MKDMFSTCGKEYYTGEALGFTSEIDEALRPIFNKYYAAGYKRRELELLMINEVSLIVLSTVLRPVATEEPGGSP